MTAQRHRAAIAAALAIFGIFAVFAGDGLRAWFTPDDMMNLYFAWSPRLMDLTHSGRPVGDLVYRALFAVFGLNPLPYRIVCLALVLGNLALLYPFCARLAESRETAALACLLAAYHAHLADLYYSSGTIYDLLCSFFLLAAFVWYLGIRRAGRYPGGRETAGLIAFYLFALESKEMAVVLPAWIALYEWLYHGRKVRLRSLVFLWIAVPLAALYAVAKTAGAHRMTANPAYALDFSAHAFMAAWKHYLGDLFYGAIAFNSFKAVLLWVAMAAFALAVRRRCLLFAWFAILLGALPVVFVPPRGFYAIYAALPGWYLYAGGFLVWLRDALERHAPRWSAALGVRPGQLALFLIVAALLIPLHRREKTLGNAWVPEAHATVSGVLGELGRFGPMPRGARVLFLSDPYPKDEWMLTFIFRLYYRDNSIVVDRAKVWPQLAVEPARSAYNRIFVLGDAGLRLAGLSK
jgi:hypothetical protein